MKHDLPARHSGYIRNRSLNHPEFVLAKVIVIHGSHHSVGGVANATLFYALALNAVGHSAEVWSASQGLVDRADELGLDTLYHPWLKNVGLALIAPDILKRVFQVRGKTRAVIHQGEKLWLFGHVYLRKCPDSVVFHNDKVNQRRLFKNWLSLSSSQTRMLWDYAEKRNLHPSIHKITNGPLPCSDRTHACKPGKHPVVIGCLGNFGGKKAVDVLVRAFAHAVSNGHDIRLILAGDGPERQMCQRLAEEVHVSDRIEWPGWLNGTGAFFNSIDVFCLPSRVEPFGIVVTEAMQAKLPVIATMTDGPRDIVRHGETGWLVPFDNVDALSDAIADASRDPDRLRQMGEAGYRRYLDEYSTLAAGKVLEAALGLTPLKMF